MKIKLTKQSVATDIQIQELEASTGGNLPDDFKLFLKENNGARPETNIFNINDVNDSGVNDFIPVHKIVKESQNIENLSKGGMAVAWAEGGNYVVIENGKVLFWDHEDPENKVVLADSFTGFLNQINPFDPSTIELKPGQVKEAWIDPEFLKSLES